MTENPSAELAKEILGVVRFIKVAPLLIAWTVLITAIAWFGFWLLWFIMLWIATHATFVLVLFGTTIVFALGAAWVTR